MQRLFSIGNENVALDEPKFIEFIKSSIVHQIGTNSGYISDIYLQATTESQAAEFIEKLLELAPNDIPDINKLGLIDDEGFNADNYHVFENMLKRWHSKTTSNSNPALEGFPEIGFDLDTDVKFELNEIDWWYGEIYDSNNRYTEKCVRLIKECYKLVNLKQVRNVEKHKRKLLALESNINDQLQYTNLFNAICREAYANGNESDTLYIDKSFSIELMATGRGGLIALDFSKVGALDAIIVGGFCFFDKRPMRYNEPCMEVMKGMLMHNYRKFGDPVTTRDRPYLYKDEQVHEETSLFAF